MILGLDISTSTIGYTILDPKGKLISIGYVKPEGKSLFEKVRTAFDDLAERLACHSPITAIYAEAPNIMFKAGFSSAQVLSIILRFNGAFLFTLSSKLNTLPQEAMAVSIRKQVIGVGRFKTNPKEEVLNWVKSQEVIDWPTIQKGKNQGKLAPECFDMADSYVVARYGLLNESRNSKAESRST